MELHLLEILKSVEGVSVKQFNDDVYHVVTHNIIVKKWWNLKNIILRSIQMQFLLRNVLQNLRVWGHSKQQLVNYCSDCVNIALFGDFILLAIEVLI